MRSRNLGFAAVAVGMAASASAVAQDSANDTRWVVQSFCATCHEVPGMPDPTWAEGGPAPSFQAMADQPELYTTERMTAFLQDPHFPMQRLRLSDADIAALVAFIEGLRRPDAAQRSKLEP